MNDYTQARIKALMAEVERLNGIIRHYEQRMKNKDGYMTDLNDPVFDRRLKYIDVNYEHETGK